MNEEEVHKTEDKGAPKPEAKPAPAAAKVEAPSLTPLEMLSPQLKTLIERLVRSGEPITIQVGKDVFTGRVFRAMLHEGWIALEHVDGRRKMFFVYTGGKITTRSGETVELAGQAK